MNEFIDVGSAPTAERCAQVGTAGYHERALHECTAFIRQLRRIVGEEPNGARLAIKSNPHDFGNYLSVICYYDPNRPEAVDYAFRCEAESPNEWDDEARRQLAGEREHHVK